MQGKDRNVIAERVITAYLAATKATAPDPAPVSGWRLVPVEPDEMQLVHMKDAFRTTHVSGVGGQTVDATFNRDHAKEIAAYRAALAAAPEPPVSDGWQPIETAPSAKHVLAAYKNQSGKWRVVKAVRYEQFQCAQPMDCEGESAEYCEEKDEYFIPAGWYELIDNWDDFSSVSIYEGEPSHWRPLPAPPKNEQEAAR